jgi:signal transduction histidine kinase
MRERVALLGGDIDIQTNPGEGTRVSIAIPV